MAARWPVPSPAPTTCSMKAATLTARTDSLSVPSTRCRIRATLDKVLIEALYTLLMVSFFGARRTVAAFHAAARSAAPAAFQLLSILARTFSDPARLAVSCYGPGRRDRRSAHRDKPGASSAAIAGSYLDRIGDCREPLWRAIRHGRGGRRGDLRHRGAVRAETTPTSAAAGMKYRRSPMSLLVPGHDYHAAARSLFWARSSPATEAIRRRAAA